MSEPKIKFGLCHDGEGHPGDQKVMCINCFSEAWLCQYEGPTLPKGAAFPGICSYNCFEAIIQMSTEEFIDKAADYLSSQGLEIPQEQIEMLKKDMSMGNIQAALNATDNPEEVLNSFRRNEETIPHPSMKDDNDDSVMTKSIPIATRIGSNKANQGPMTDDDMAAQLRKFFESGSDDNG